jgi:hypothetical protein
VLPELTADENCTLVLRSTIYAHKNYYSENCYSTFPSTGEDTTTTVDNTKLWSTIEAQDNNNFIEPGTGT